MDLQPPPRCETEILVSVTNQELENFDSELARLCNNPSTPRPPVNSISQIADDFEESATGFRRLLAEADRMLPSFEKNVDNIVQLEQRINTLEKSTSLLNNQQTRSAVEQENLKQQLHLCKEEIKQINDNQIELNTRYFALKKSLEASDQAYPRDIKFLRARIDLLENKQAASLSQFRCFAVGVIGFIAGFLIWFYAHKAELLR